MRRRRFIHRLGAGLAVASAAPVLARTGVTPAEAFDPVMEAFMKERAIPGGALAVVKGGQIVHQRGYGFADRRKKMKVSPTSLFRLASLSKPITCLAIYHLVREKKLTLDQHVFDLLKLGSLDRDGAKLDDRWKQVTVLQLMQHTAGWDRGETYDPMFRSREIASALDQKAPAQPWDIIRYMLQRPLSFDPGTKYVYSNFGYCLLGRVIETVSRQSYEAYVQQSILAPMGVTSMRIGRTLYKERVPNEVMYYMPDNDEARAVVGSPTRKVPLPYGGFWLESMDAHGGWIASAADLSRITMALHKDLPEEILEPPAPPVSRDEAGNLKPHYYGGGWLVRPKGAANQPNIWHNGSLPGTFTIWVLRGDRVGYAALFNQRSKDKKTPDKAIDGLLYQAANRVTKWDA